MAARASVVDGGGTTVRFSLADAVPTLRLVRLVQELRRPRLGPPFHHAPRPGEWWLDFRPGDVDRFEYQFQLVHPDGGTETVCDPDNPRRAPGAFGDKSVVELPDYRPPAWLEHAPRPARLRTVAVDLPGTMGTLPVTIWTAPGVRPRAPAPLLVVHDGPEYAELAALTRYLDWLAATGRVPPMRTALLPPLDRNEHYAASPAYRDAVETALVPALAVEAPTAGAEQRVGIGASLGALSMLHLHRRIGGWLGGLFLQSGSFFQPYLDPHEVNFPRFGRITSFVGQVVRARAWDDPVRTVLTCGAVEENLANNRRIAAALGRQGYPVDLVENRDAHNYTAWRDTFDPHLTDLLAELWA